MSTKMNVPELRFGEFRGEWEEKSLGTVLSFKNGINADKEQYGSGYKFINVLDIINNMTIKHENIIGSVNVSKEIFEKNKVEYGNILFQRSSETREDAGQSNVYLDKEFPATFGGFVIRGQQKIDYKAEFVNYMFKTQHARKEIAQKSNGSTRYNVGQETLSKVTIYLPSKSEQEKIASFLNSVDSKIEQLSKKKTLLEQYKKGVMQKIFSQTLRFRDDNGNEFPEWVEKKLGALSKITTGKLDANAMVNNAKYRFYTCAKEYYHIDSYAFDTDALIVSGNGANVGYIHHYNGKFNAYQRTYVLDKFCDNIIYVKYFLDKHLSKRIIQEKNEGNTPYIIMGTLSEMEIKLPSLKEQTKIASFLSSLDKKIELTDKELNATKEFKKALLQKMFV